MIRIQLRCERGNWVAHVRRPGDSRVVTLGTRDLIAAMTRAHQLYPSVRLDDIDVKGDE